MSPSSCYGNPACHCSCLGCLNIAPFGSEMETIAFESADSITAQWTSSRQDLEALTCGLRDTLNIPVPQDLAWRLINLPSPFRLQVNTWREMLPLFLCDSDGTSPNRTAYSQHQLHQLGLGVKVLWIIFQVFVFFHLPWVGRGIN